MRVINNFPKKGIKFQDITSITDDPLLFVSIINEISKFVKKNHITNIKDFKPGKLYKNNDR